jgi:hypothetical protein
MADSRGPRRPQIGEFNPYYGGYIDLVPEGEPQEFLTPHGEETIRLLRTIPNERLAIRPAPEEWSPLDIALHVADTERVMAFRLLWIARGNATPLPGFDQDAFADVARANELSLDEIVEHLRTVRAASIALARSIRPEDWPRLGAVSDHPMSARALLYIILGHELYHQADFRRVMSHER